MPEEFELKYFTSNGQERISGDFRTLQETIDFYYQKRKTGHGWGQWRKVEFKEFGPHKYRYNPNEWQLI